MVKKIMRLKEELKTTSPCRVIMFGKIMRRSLTEQDRAVIENTRSGVKIKSKHTNLMNNSQNEGYNGK